MGWAQCCLPARGATAGLGQERCFASVRRGDAGKGVALCSLGSAKGQRSCWSREEPSGGCRRLGVGGAQQCGGPGGEHRRAGPLPSPPQRPTSQRSQVWAQLGCFLGVPGPLSLISFVKQGGSPRGWFMYFGWNHVCASLGRRRGAVPTALGGECPARALSRGELTPPCDRNGVSFCRDPPQGRWGVA